MKQRHRKRRAPVRDPWSGAAAADVTFLHSSWLPDLMHAPQAEEPPQRLYQGELLQVDDGFRFVDSTTQPA